MPSDDPIILDPPKKPAAISIKPRRLDTLRNALKRYSTWAWAAVASLPVVYTQLLALGPVPEQFQKTLWAVAAVGLVASNVVQKRKQDL